MNRQLDSEFPTGLREKRPRLDDEITRQATPLAAIGEKQRRPLPSGKPAPDFSLATSNSAQGMDEEENNDSDLTKSLRAIHRDYWAGIVDRFRHQIPASMLQGTFEKLSVAYPWTSHPFYRSMTGIETGKTESSLKKLKNWMYGTGSTTLATWRDTLRTKTGDDTKVPWLQREKVLALSVILAGVGADCKAGRSSDGRLRMKYDDLKMCKLTYLISNQERVADEYWDGFVEELENDPEQEYLYNKVMQNEQSPTLGSSTNGPSLRIHDQGAHERGDQRHRGSPRSSPREGYSSIIGDSPVFTPAGTRIYRYSGSHEPFTPTRRTLLPAEDTRQHTQDITSGQGLLQDKVRILEDEVKKLRGKIELISRPLPEVLVESPRASSQPSPTISETQENEARHE